MSEMDEAFRLDYATKARMEEVLHLLNDFAVKHNAGGCSRPTWKALEATRAGLDKDIACIVRRWD